MPSKKPELPADVEFDIVDPDTLRDALRVLQVPPDAPAVSVKVELTTIQAQFLAMRGNERHGLEGDAAIKREIETLVFEDIGAGLFDLRSRVSRWQGIIRAARGPEKGEPGE
ncbi:hypothetical protein [Paracoccus fontiphilus]|uniref:hypothetical protein n=1 Tax=Paracoccus fontiphilus TaxID=1815556 RepID=UPI001A9586B9|nr:hypothetical protein [Paracoccus fontiphilus]